MKIVDVKGVLLARLDVQNEEQRVKDLSETDLREEIKCSCRSILDPQLIQELLVNQNDDQTICADLYLGQ